MTLPRDQFDRLILEHLDSLYRIALRLTHNPNRAEDLVQEACYRALRSWHTFDLNTGGIRPWLVRILRNTYLTTGQREARQPTATDDQALDVSAAAPPVPPPSAGELLHENMDQELVRAIDELQEEYRTVLVLWALEEFSYQEIADALEIPIGTVMSRLHRARSKLISRLKQYALREGIIRE
jgi:RNA polymerase sigma-70 factor (ECF subfamily)